MNKEKDRTVLLCKETFCKALQMLEQQEDTDDKFSKALNLVGDGYFLYGTKDLYREALLMVLKEAMNDRYDYIDWWLYDTDDYHVWTKDGKHEWNLQEPAALYDYIVNECQGDPE